MMSPQQPVTQAFQQQTPPSPVSRPFDLATLLLALGFGCLFWLHFFDWGRVVLSFEDWPNQAYYLNISRLAVAHGQAPWIANWSAHGTDKFLSVPEILMGPQILFLPWLSNGWFVTLDVCLLYGLGVWGWRAVKKQHSWSPEAFLLAIVATSFNGFVVSHLAAGHLMWSGCFLAPWLLLSLQKMLVSEDAFCWLPVSFLLFALFLLGAFHMAIWWIFFIGLAALARPRALVPAFFAIAGGCAMACCRILPAMVFMGEKFQFLTGYPSLRILLKSFTEIQGYTPGVQQTITVVTADMLGWWEFDHYTGWPLLLFIVLFASVAVCLWHKQAPALGPLAAASLGMAFLSYGTVYSVFYSLPLPLFHSERVATRFIAVSFVGLLFVALRGLESQQASKARPLARLFVGLVLAFALHDAWAGAQPWLLARLEPAHAFSWYFPELEKLAPAIVAKDHQTTYQAVVLGSFTLSLLALLPLTALSFSPEMRRRLEAWLTSVRGAFPKTRPGRSFGS